MPTANSKWYREVMRVARVLVVEDQPTIAMVLHELLTDEGHEVETVFDGSAALERLSRSPLPEVALVDLFMPGISGRELVETMRENSKLKHIPVILVTGALPREEDYPPSDMYQAVITKPFDVMDVVNRVQCLATHAS